MWYVSLQWRHQPNMLNTGLIAVLRRVHWHKTPILDPEYTRFYIHYNTKQMMSGRYNGSLALKDVGYTSVISGG